MRQRTDPGIQAGNQRSVGEIIAEAENAQSSVPTNAELSSYAREPPRRERSWVQRGDVEARWHALAQGRNERAAATVGRGAARNRRVSSPNKREPMYFLSDLRYAIRLLVRSPRFTLLTVLVLSGGLALSIFTFSFLYTAMLRPLPLSGGQRIVRVEQRDDGGTSSLDAHDVALMRPFVRTLAGMGAFTSRSFVIGDEQRRRVIEATVTESNIFDVARTRALIGRVLFPADQLPGAEPVIVLSHRTWQGMFGSDPDILHKHITLNGQRTRVIGVMPAGFAFPVASDSWVPMSRELFGPDKPGTSFVNLYARLGDGVSAEQAETELSALLYRARSSYNTEPTLARVTAAVRSFPMAQFNDSGPLLLSVLNLLAALILMLACVNVTSLLLARANERAREIAVRMALGASRARLAVQSLLESSLLCLAGGALAIVMAAWGLRFINHWAQTNLSGNLAFWWVWGLDRASLMAAGVFITVTMAILSAVVALRVTGTRFTSTLREGGARAGGRREGRVSRALVLTQVATVSVLMLVGVLSGIVAQRIVHLDVGYDTNRLLSASLGLPADRYNNDQRRALFYAALATEMNGAAALERTLFRARLADIEDDHAVFELEGAALSPVELRPRAYVQALLGPLETLGVSPRGGRFFDARDDQHGAPVAIVSSAFAAKHFAGATSIGRRIRLTGLAGEEWRTVVGVASDVLLGNPFSRRRSADAVYIPLSQSGAASVTIFLKHNGDVVAAQATFYQALMKTDPLLTPPSISTYEEMLSKTSLLARSTTKLFALCFAFALLLAVSGTYGLMARSIGRRSLELGIRQALGATRRSVIRMLLGQGARQLGTGVLIAAPLMGLVSYGFWHFFSVTMFESVGSGLLVAATIVAVVLAATYVPARRVLRSGPQAALARD
jgi:predicted permease